MSLAYTGPARLGDSVSACTLGGMSDEPNTSSDAQLYALAETIGRELRGAGWRLVTAESCTAGWIAKALTDVPGSSQWFDSGFVTYSNTAKMRDVGVSAQTLAGQGAVSESAVRQMADGALRVTGADMAIAVSGIAGPDGGTAEKPVGTVWFGLATPEAQGLGTVCELRRFDGDRDQVRRQSVAHALRLALRSLQAGRAEDAPPWRRRSEP